jgi:hypothetical protein
MKMFFHGKKPGRKKKTRILCKHKIFLSFGKNIYIRVASHFKMDFEGGTKNLPTTNIYRSLLNTQKVLQNKITTKQVSQENLLISIFPLQYNTVVK